MLLLNANLLNECLYMEIGKLVDTKMCSISVFVLIKIWQFVKVSVAIVTLIGLHFEANL